VRRVTLLVGLVGVVSGPIAWMVSDQLEAQNEFCVSCHLSDGPLHEAKARGFEAVPVVSLAGLHAHESHGFRCIDCHGGASFVNKLRVKTVAARDALIYLTGRFSEPDDMEHPLWDEDCAQCHARYAARRDDDFRAFAAHNVEAFQVRCVTCHRAHPTGARGELAFLDPQIVRPQCRTCHEEF